MTQARRASREPIAAGPPTRAGERGRRTAAAARVEFAGGHRIAVETEAVVRRESISNTVGSLALILPLLFLVFRSPGSSPSARCRRRSRWCSCSACSGLPARRCRPPRPASARDAVRPRRRRRRAALRRLHARGPRAARSRRRQSTAWRTVDEHAARHVDDGRDVLRPDVRRLPQPASSSAR